MQKNKKTFDWKNVDTVFLDMDGTLLDLHYDNFIWTKEIPKAYAEKNNLSISDAENFVKTKIKKYSKTLNAYCFDHWEKTLKLNMMDFHYKNIEKIRYRSDSLYFLKKLKNTHCKVFILTNAYPENLHFKLYVTNLEKYVEEIHTSHEFGFAKEDIKFWQKLRNKISFDPKRSIFIDDNIFCLHSAKNYGIKYLYAILSPDSDSCATTTEEFSGIHNFSEII